MPDERQNPGSLREVEQLQEALAHALAVIENYQADIRARGLDREGFCQGDIYLQAPTRLRVLLERLAATPAE